MLGELRAADAGAVAALIVGANPRRGIDADDAAAERHRSVFRRRTVGAFVLLALAPAAVAIPATAIAANQGRRRCVSMALRATMSGSSGSIDAAAYVRTARWRRCSNSSASRSFIG